jgi:hypothetical protein
MGQERPGLTARPSDPPLDLASDRSEPKAPASWRREQTFGALGRGAVTVGSSAALAICAEALAHHAASVPQ